MDFFSVTTLETNFKKSINDLHKSYKYIKLSNGLRALLISDPQTDTTATSICVGSGSHNDTISGLAHFVEHMVFMGTEQYPNPNLFFQVLKSMNGNSNAYTTGDYTNFYFEVPLNQVEIEQELGLSYILKIFSNFFIRPLFNDQFINVEINSINDEHQLNLNNNEKLLYQGLKILANESHPFSNFGTGDKSTLNDVKRLKVEGLKYFNRYYYAENLTLVMKSSLSLNQLQKLAIANFSSILESKQPRRLSRSSVSSIDRNPNLYSKIFIDCNRILFIKSKRSSILRLFLPIEEENLFYENVWCNLLGDESENSIHFYLMEMKIIKSMYVFTQTLSKNNKILILEFELRKLDLDIIVCTIFEFVNQLITNQNLYSTLVEYSKIFKYNCYFGSTNTDSMDEISELSQSLQNRNLDIQNLILGSSYEMKGSVDNFIEKTKQVFDMSNLNAIVIGDETQHKQYFKDPYYNFEYRISDLKLKISNYTFPKFYILENNPFLKVSHKELDSLINESIIVKSQMLKLTTQKYPKLLDYSKFHELWLDKIDSRMITASFQIKFAKLSNTVENFILMELLVESIGEKLIPKFYICESALFSWGINSNYCNFPSLGIRVHGPKLSFVFFLTTFIIELKKLVFVEIKHLTYKKFVNVKNKLISQYKILQGGSGEDDTSVKQIIAGSTFILEDGVHNLDERFEYLEMVEKQHLLQFVNEIDSSCKFVAILVSGDITYQEAFQINKVVNSFTNHERIVLEQVTFANQSSMLLRHGNYSMKLSNSNLKDPNDVVYNYIQICKRSCGKHVAYGEFVAYLLSQTAHFYLRTKKRIGYMVFSGVRYNKQTMGIYTLCSSSTFEHNFIMNEIEIMLFEMELQLINLSQEELDEKIDCFIKNKDVKSNGIPANILHSVSPNIHSNNYTNNNEHMNQWEKIITRNFRFKGVNGGEYIDEGYLNNLTVDELISFFQEKISIKSKVKSSLSIFIDSKLGKQKAKHNEDKTLLSNLLKEKQYNLNSLQIENLLNSSNSLSEAINRLNKTGYNISMPKTSRLSKLVGQFQRNLLDDRKQVQAMQRQVINKYGNRYRDNKVVSGMIRVKDKQELNATVVEIEDEMTILNDFFDDYDLDEDNDFYDY